MAVLSLVAFAGILFFTRESIYEVKALFFIISKWFLGPVMIIIPLILIVDFFKSKRKESFIILVSFSITAITAFRDLRFDQNFIEAEF
ncbi:MAG: hypothetical protein HUN05_13220 [Desulfobacter sp.]|nr:MAG: hypothetical protein HUN05_13220 [Desulfobacter sp.]